MAWLWHLPHHEAQGKNNKIQGAARKKQKANTKAINVDIDEENLCILYLLIIFCTQGPVFVADNDSIVELYAIGHNGNNLLPINFIVSWSKAFLTVKVWPLFSFFGAPILRVMRKVHTHVKYIHSCLILSIYILLRLVRLCAAPWKVMGLNVLDKKSLQPWKRLQVGLKRFWISDLVTSMVSVDWYSCKVTSLVSCTNGQMTVRKGLRHLFNEINSKTSAAIASVDLNKDARSFAPFK